MKLMVLLFGVSACAQMWTPQTSGTTASLRGVSAVNSSVVWASGNGGTWLRTTDGGVSWSAAVVPGAEDLDFRGIRAIDGNIAYLLSSGSGAKSRIYKTVNAGEAWTLLFTNPDAQGFFDALAFWDAKHGIVAGDPVGGQMTIFTTVDGGTHWSRQNTPPALPDEGAFAASNSSLSLRGKGEVWFGTGGKGVARIFYSKDAGRTWSVNAVPIRNDSASAGIFALSFSDKKRGLAVGGDYSRDSEARHNIALTFNGGRTWIAPDAPGPHGFRSAAAWLPDTRTWIVTGTSGSDVSTDRGHTWRQFDSGAYNALAVFGRAVWAVGPKGRVARFKL